MRFKILLLVTIVTSLKVLAGPYDDRKEVPAALAAFREGSVEYATDKSGRGEKHCQNFKNWFHYFCVEGFYLAGHLDRLAGQKGDMIAAVKARLGKDLPTDRNLRVSFLRSLGFSFAQFDLDPRKMWDGLQKLTDEEKLSVIDGWGGGQYPRYGYEVARQNCQAASLDSLRAACFWGMGRGFFFSGIPAGNSPFYDDNFIGGYIFARTLTDPTFKSVGEAKKGVSKNARVAEFYKQLLVKPVDVKKAAPKLTACLQDKHITHCFDKVE